MLSVYSPVANQVRVGSPTGTLFASNPAGNSTNTTGKWVANGTLFYIVNTADGSTLASVSVGVTTAGCATPTPTPTPIPGTQLTSGSALADSVSFGAWKYYYISIPANSYRLTVTTTGPNFGNSNLYVRNAGQPTTGIYDYVSSATYNTESITVYPSTAAGIWYIGVYGVSGSPAYSITATVTPCAADTGQACDDSNACTGNGIRQCSGACTGAPVIGGSHNSCDKEGQCVVVPNTSTECMSTCSWYGDCQILWNPFSIPKTYAQGSMTSTGGTSGFTTATYPYNGTGSLYILARTRNGAGTYSAVGSVAVAGAAVGVPIPKPLMFPDGTAVNSGEYYAPITVSFNAGGTNAANLFTTAPATAPTAIYFIPRAGFDNPFSAVSQITDIITTPPTGWGVATSWPTCSGTISQGCRIPVGSTSTLTLPTSGTYKDASYALIARFAGGDSWIGRRYRTTILDPVIENVRYNTSVTPNKLELTVRNAGSAGSVILNSTQTQAVTTTTYVASNVAGSAGSGLAVVSVSPATTNLSSVRYAQVSRTDVSPAKTSPLYSYRFPEGTNLVSTAFVVSPTKSTLLPGDTATLTAKLGGTNTASTPLTWTIKDSLGADASALLVPKAETPLVGTGNTRLTFTVTDTVAQQAAILGKTFKVRATETGSNPVKYAEADVVIADRTKSDLSKHMFIEKLPGTSIVYLNTANAADNTQLPANNTTPSLVLSSETVTGAKVVFQGKGSMTAGAVTLKGTAVADGIERSFDIPHNGTIDLTTAVPTSPSPACPTGGCRGLKNPYFVVKTLPSGVGVQANKVLLSLTNDVASVLDGVVSVSTDIQLPRALAPITYVYTDTCFQIGVVLKNAQDEPEAIVTGTCPVTVPTSSTTNTTTCMSGGDPGPIGIFTGEKCTTKLRGYLGCQDASCP